MRCYKSERFENFKNILSKPMLDISEHKVFLCMMNNIINQFLNLFDLDTELCSLSLFNIPSEENYDLTNNELDIEDMIEKIVLYLDKRTTIYNDDTIISVNVCPFDGLEIRHGFIVKILDLYFY